MGYEYENSDPERFQEMVQALLLPEWPRLQCFPVGQPDGGRDGLARLLGNSRHVLQVKFKRRDEPGDDVADWLIAALKGEREKVELLRDLGATNYVMATNVRGTSHLHNGSVDIVQAWMDENFPIPSQCLYRADLDRRLDGNFDLRWRYAELLNGTDGIRLALESLVDADGAQRSLALRNFLRQQMRDDASIRFKQVDLTNDLVDLFIDVPADFPRDRGRRGPREKHLKVIADVYGRQSRADTESFLYHHYGDVWWEPDGPSGVGWGLRPIGAASLLLDEEVQTRAPRVVLEGAPGQGKSTLTQYVCQVHRARYLANEGLLTKIDPKHLASPLRVPIKVDLRGLATWLAGRDPFLPQHPDAADGWQPTLECYLARLISAQSGGLEFTAYDLNVVANQAPTLIFFDGLDEVADVEARKSLITCINEGLDRLDDGGKIQVVITSRPAAFANSPGFSRNDYLYLELLNLTAELANEYCRNWIASRQLNESDASEVSSIFTSKLSLPHIRDLARNPMQLAILLSLIHSLGHSLPDERTQLYASYMDKFLTREAEKSLAVRTHRLLLVKLHQYVAWKLQSAAESTSGTSGSISPGDLRSLLHEYLVEHSHPLDILDELFTGALERVYLLVLRRDDSYEFEVQPVREFFCASYLYETAPTYVPPGEISPARGTREQRFDAMAQNPYWTNVLRFYAGKFFSGELGGLYFRLRALAIGNPQAFRPRELGTVLLRDWVFKESPQVTAEVVRSTFDDLGLAVATRGGETIGESRAVTLPSDCGRETLVELIVDRMQDDPAGPQARTLMPLLAANASFGVDTRIFEFASNVQGHERTAWLEVLARVAVSPQELAEGVSQLVSSDSPEPWEAQRRAVTWLGNQPQTWQRSPTLVDLVVSGFVAHDYRVLTGVARGWVGALLFPIRTMRLARRPLEVSRSVWDTTVQLTGEAPESVRRTVETVMNAFTANPASSGQMYWPIVEVLREEYGESWSAFGLAAFAAGLPSRVPVPSGAERLFDKGVDLCDRARYARLKTRGVDWWTNQLASTSDDDERAFWCVLLLGYGSKQLLGASSKTGLLRVVEELPEDALTQLLSVLPTLWDKRRSQTEELADLLRGRADDRSLALLSALRYPLKPAQADVMAVSTLGYIAHRGLIAQLGVRSRVQDGRLTASHLAALKDCAAIGIHPNSTRTLRKAKMRPDDARRVLKAPLEYPFEVVRLAEDSLDKSIHRPIGEIAEDEGWTFA